MVKFSIPKQLSLSSQLASTMGTNLNINEELLRETNENKQ